MKLPDVNVLVLCVNVDNVHHERARSWMEDAMESPAGVALAWAALSGFIRVSTRSGILTKPLKVDEALRAVGRWIEAPRSRIVQPTSSHFTILSRLLTAAGKAGNLTSDAHLAALAIEHGATLASFDRDFARFDGLDFEPLGH